jgi:histidyl-tRNA synthetase
MSKVHLPKGMRDLLPHNMLRRNLVIEKIKKTFEIFGFLPLETPAMERKETLMGKYGDEGSKLIFQILARGEAGKRGETDLALRYDLTVPLARVVAMNPSLNLPFKRYQIQPVWRADRPQKGRFREFYQCDVDIVGTDNILAEAECITIVHHSLKALGFDNFTIRLNDRRLLRAMVESIQEQGQEIAILVALDKLDKIGKEGVIQDLYKLGLKEDQTSKLFSLLEGADIEGEESISVEDNLRSIRDLAIQMGVEAKCVQLDRTLARGLDYYTGPVFETVLNDANIGSVSGGGRYDGLIGMFSGRDIPAVGVSLGLERLLVILEEREGNQNIIGTQVWVTVFNAEHQNHSLQVAQTLREAGIKTDVSFKSNKLSKQFKEAHKRNIPHVIVVGPDDVEAGTIQWKNMTSGEQKSCTIDELITALQ